MSHWVQKYIKHSNGQVDRLTYCLNFMADIKNFMTDIILCQKFSQDCKEELKLYRKQID